MVYTIDNPGEKTRRGPQYFEMSGHRGIWADDWKAVTYHESGQPLTDDEWELYHLDEDFSECHNLADEKPDKLREMIELWWIEASRHGVLPLDDRRMLFAEGRLIKGTPHEKMHYVYYPPISHMPSAAAPAFGARNWIMTAEVERDSETSDGVLVAHGTQNTGFSWYIKDGLLVFDSNALAEHSVVKSNKKVPAGRCIVGVAFTWKNDQGALTLLIDGEECGSILTPTTIRTLSTGMSIGRDALSPVTDDYQAPFPFKGKMSRIEVTHQPYRSAEDRKKDEDARYNAEMSRQ
jgi:arylsulfatase